jgi:hypothetical protein
MKFSFEQHVEIEPAVVTAAYANPAFYLGREARENISVLDVPRHERTGDHVDMDVHFRFSGTISSAVRAVIDPAKMSWITHSEVDLAGLRSDWTIVPDHYPDRLTGRGSYIFTPGPNGGTLIGVEGEIKVHVLLVGRTVEGVIVAGLKKYIAGEVAGIPDVPPL